MKDIFTFRIALICVGSLLLLFSCAEQDQATSMDNLYAWCIVPFDALKRTPQQRIDMLVNLGFSEYAYDWREENIDEMADEWKLAQESGIHVRAVWMWLDPATDTVGQLNPKNEALLRILKQEQLQTEIWLGFKPNFFEANNDNNNMERALDMISFIGARADSLDCKIGLYNHGGWFGDPRNQINIINTLPEIQMGIIYNFHHGYDQVDLIPPLIPVMLPYIYSINISGLVKGKSDISDFGTGDHEEALLKAFMDAGYEGPIGLLGHREDKDVKVMLRQNLDEYTEIKKKLLK